MLWAALLSTQVQANDLLKKCDVNWDWKLYTWKQARLFKKEAKKDWLITVDEQNLIKLAKKENKCKLKYNITQWEERITQLDKEITQWKERLAKLDEIIEILDSKK
jgi:hypothetical protein